MQPHSNVHRQSLCLVWIFLSNMSKSTGSDGRVAARETPGGKIYLKILAMLVCLRDDANEEWEKGGPGFTSLLQNLPLILRIFSSLH